MDVDRSVFIKQYFHVDWPERQRYHLMINASMGQRVAVETIIDVVGRLAKE